MVKELSVFKAKAILTALGFVILLALLGQVRIPLPFTPVPLTLQTLGLLFMAYYLPLPLALGTVALYLMLGAMGLPFFSGGKGGLLVLSGPTGGYLIGFFFMVYFVAFAKERGLLNNPASAFFVALLGHLLVYLFGTLWFLAGYSQQGLVNNLKELLILTVIPFVPSDLMKCVLFSAFVFTEKKLKRG